MVFYNGWGMDARAVAHLTGDMDVLMVSDYRTLEVNDVPNLSGYVGVYLVAWSMGVWAAANSAGKWLPFITRAIAINGTERPVDDLSGIPLQVYALTERGMNERGRDKFFMRMLHGKEEWERFPENKSERRLEEQLEELTAIRMQAETCRETIRWDKVYISDNDVIFQTNNQLHWWEERAAVEIIPAAHYPFYFFRTWNEFLDDGC